ncbi:MAG: UDP-glucose 4-epimerase GalE [Oxalobacter sp.]|nr:UDP-glucose 4-epimerase GalE [Oxalobacter sp.]
MAETPAQKKTRQAAGNQKTGEGAILVTGGAGYIGSHCALALLEAGRDIVILDSLELGHRETVETIRAVGKTTHGRLKGFFIGDLNRRADIEAVLNQNMDITAVIHFAAYSQVAESVRDPGKYYRNNIVGSLNLLDAMRSHGINRIVFSSTAATYGEPQYTPIDEEHPKNPVNPYGMSKHIVETIMDDYDRAYGIKSVRLRYFNAAGADSKARIGEWHEPETHLIPNILKAAKPSKKEGKGRDTEQKIFQLYGTDYDTRDGTCVRDYIHVEDLAQAHIRALEYLEQDNPTTAFNLGTNDGSTVREVFAVCEQVTGQTIPLKEQPRRPGDPAVLIADNIRAKNTLSWTPEKTLIEAVQSAWGWEKNRTY